jgi:hypothetical protein
MEKYFEIFGGLKQFKFHAPLREKGKAIALGEMILSSRDKDILLAVVSQQQRLDMSKKERLIMLLHGAPRCREHSNSESNCRSIGASTMSLSPKRYGKESCRNF